MAFRPGNRQPNKPKRELMSTLPNRTYWPTHGWRTARPQTQGVDEIQLHQTDRYIQTHLPQVTSLLVVRHGYLVFERYYHGYGAADLQNTQSVTKSLISALIGIALEQGYLQSLEQKVLELLPEYASVVRDERMHTITLRHLLTMSAGFANEVAEPGLFERWSASADPVAFTLAQTLQTPPGLALHYSNMNVHLLSAILTRTTGMNTADFAGRVLFTPLGIQPGMWPADPTGIAYGAGWLALTPRAMAKFGYLYLNQGRWENQTILNPAWVAASTQRYYPGDPWIEGIEGYGYLWWVGHEHHLAIYYAAGYGGQYIGVVPALDLVVAMTGDSGDVSQDHRPVISDHVLPAVQQE
jgi:CubicO group peptidase (beta-lactamase class C family)